MLNASNPFLKKTLCGISFLLLITLYSSMIFVNNADAYPRQVLFEDFTSTTCPPCAGAAPSLEAGLEDVGDELVAPVAFHVWWPNPGNDPWFLDNESDNRTRVGYYGINSAPTFKIDGVTYNGARSQAGFASAIRARQREESPMMIDLQVRFQDENLMVDVTVTSDENMNNQKLFICLNEDHVEYAAPTGQRDHYDAMVKMIPNASGVSFDIAAEGEETFQYEQSLNGLGWHELEMSNLILVAWVQDGNQEVHQAKSFLSPAVDIQGWEIADEADGNGDGRAEPGETAGLVVTVENGPNRGVMENITVTVTCDDEQIELLTNMFDIESINGGETVDNSDNPFSFIVAEELIPHPVTFTTTISDVNGEELIIKELTFTIGWPDVLIVDAARNVGATNAINELFDTEKFPFADRIDKEVVGIITSDIMESYDMVIWHSFNAEAAVIDEWEEELLMGFLHNGGTLVLSSLGYVTNDGDSRLMRNYLKTSLDMEDTGTNWVHSVEGNEFFEGSNVFAGGPARSCAGFPQSTPSLNALDGGEPVLRWYNDDDEEYVGYAGIATQTEDYKSLVLSFPIESIGAFMASDQRADFMERIWNWHTSESDVPFGEETGPVSFALDVAYPNPFNSSTVVPFSLDRSSDVTLSVFDLSGREIVRLINGSMTAGQHSINVDAGQLGMSTGVYYLRLLSNDNSASQKILYLK